MDPLRGLILVLLEVWVVVKSEWLINGGRLVLEQDMIKSLLGEQPGSIYDWRIRPRGMETSDEVSWRLPQPVFVTVNMYLRTISKVDDVNMEYSFPVAYEEV